MCVWRAGSGGARQMGGESTTRPRPFLRIIMSHFSDELCRVERYRGVTSQISASMAAEFSVGATELPREPARHVTPSDAKLAALAASGTLNRSPLAVRDPLFR